MYCDRTGRVRSETYSPALKELQGSFYLLSDSGPMRGLPLMYHHRAEEDKMSQTSKAWPWSCVRKKSFLVCLFFGKFQQEKLSALSLNVDM